MPVDGVRTQRAHGMAPRVDKPSGDEVSPTSSLRAEADGAQASDVRATTRRGVRTVLLSAVALAGLAALAVGTLFTSLGPPERSAPGTQPGAEADGPAIAGTISIAAELRGRLSEGETLFIILRKGPGPPFAVKRITGPRLPLTYWLGPEDVMVAGTPFEGEVTVSARLSRTGAAGPPQPGDLEGEHPGRVRIGARGVDIVITRIR